MKTTMSIEMGIRMRMNEYVHIHHRPLSQFKKNQVLSISIPS